MTDRISSLDKAYKIGDLSIFPSAIDSFAQLYFVTNNASTVLAHSMSYTSNYIVVNDASQFPSAGLIKIDNEIIYYDSMISNAFTTLIRGFLGTTQAMHTVGTSVYGSVMAEHHNVCKDAIYNIEHYIGTSVNPAAGTFNYLLKSYESQFLAPTPSFRGYPKSGTTPLSVVFQNFTTNTNARFLWDFGDGAVSTELAPTHTYLSEGNFTVQLKMVLFSGASGVMTKNNYISVNNSKSSGFMYVTPESGTTSTVFDFVDQTEGDIVQRYWTFGDGGSLTVNNPDEHATTHTYATTGDYSPSLMVVFSDQSFQRVNLPAEIMVS